MTFILAALRTSSSYISLHTSGHAAVCVTARRRRSVILPIWKGSADSSNRIFRSVSVASLVTDVGTSLQYTYKDGFECVQMLGE